MRDVCVRLGEMQWLCFASFVHSINEIVCCMYDIALLFRSNILTFYSITEMCVCVFCSRGMLGWIVLILLVWCAICWSATYVALSRLNFLKR